MNLVRKETWNGLWSLAVLDLPLTGYVTFEKLICHLNLNLVFWKMRGLQSMFSNKTKISILKLKQILRCHSRDFN